MSAQNQASVTKYVATHRYGVVTKDDDENEAEQFEGTTPNTRRRLIHEEDVKQVKKLGPWATGFTLFKGTVGTGILYMPVAFVGGGWLFSVAALLLALVLTLYCIKLLIEVRVKIGGTFTEIGAKTYGRCG